MRSELENRYFQFWKKQKTKFLFKLISLVLIVLISSILLSYYLSILFLAPVIFWITISIIASFFDMPSMIASGKLSYHSSLLISEEEKDEEIIIHGGTLFDYYFVLDPTATGNQRKNMILREYLNGLLNLIEKYQHRTNLKITGTTYILNPRTAKKIGFEAMKPKEKQLLILILNYPNLTFTRSFAHRRLSFPNLKAIRTYSCTIQELSKNQEKIQQILGLLQRKQ